MHSCVPAIVWARRKEGQEEIWAFTLAGISIARSGMWRSPITSTSRDVMVRGGEQDELWRES